MDSRRAAREYLIDIFRYIYYSSIVGNSRARRGPREALSLTSVNIKRMSGGRGGDPRTLTAAEKEQAKQVSLRRIGGLFRPYWPQLTFVSVLIVASSAVGLASPFLLRAIIDTAIPRHELRLLSWLVIGMVAVAAITAAFGVVQTWVSTKVGQRAEIWREQQERQPVADHLEAGQRGGVEFLPDHPVGDDVLDVVGHHRQGPAAQVDPAGAVAQRGELGRRCLRQVRRDLGLRGGRLGV